MKLNRTIVQLVLCLLVLGTLGGLAHVADAGGAGTGTNWTGSPYQNASLGTYTPTTTVSGDATWSTTLTGVWLAYSWNRWTLVQNHPECFTGQTGNFSSDTMNSTCVSGFVPSGSDINVTINQEARIYDTSTGALIANNAVLTPGQTVRLEFKKLVPENIQWFGTGYSLDSPYGEWRASAAAPPRVSSSNGGVLANHVTCNIRDYSNSIDIIDDSTHAGCMEKLRENAVQYMAPASSCKTTGTDGSGNTICIDYWYYYAPPGPGLMASTTADSFCTNNGYPHGTTKYKFDVYAPLEVNPPTRTLTVGGLTCVSAAGDSDSDLAWTCTIPNTPGATLTPIFNYSSTYGYFYYRYYDYRNMDYSSYGASNNGYNYGGAGCYGNNIPLYKVRDSVASDPSFNPVSEQGLHTGDVEATPYKLTVPAMTVPFTLKVATVNAPPAAPTITGAATGTTATNYTFTITSTDPDADTIRYGIDWNKDGTLDQWVPASGYVSSGTSQSAVKQWAAAGAVTFQALAQDDNGSNSGWSTHTITISTPQPNLAAGAVSPTTATAGTAVTLSSTITNSGAGATGAGFTDLFQRATDASGTNTTDIGTYASAAIAASGSNTASLSYTFPSAATWYVRACADKNSSAGTGTIAESNEADNCGAWTAITVAAAPLLPNLTPATPTPASALVNKATTLSSLITNNGTATTGSGFTSLYQRATDSAGTGATDIGTATSSALGVGATTTAKLAYTFTTTGTWYIRACADKSSSAGTGTISESNEADNCSAWRSVNVGQPNLTAGAVSPTSATAGTPVTLSATVTNNGTGATGSGFTNLFQSATDASGTGTTDIATATSSSVAPSGTTVMQKAYTFATGGTWYVHACADKSSAANTGTISESNEADNCGPWTAITVTAPPQPNLTAGAVSPTTATAGTPVTLSATVTNNGASTTGAVFTNLFQRATDSSGTGATDIGTDASPIVAAAGTDITQLSYPFPSAATWYVRACADKNSSAGTGTITESNEADNCGAWTAVAVAAAPTLSCTVNPSVITTGQSVRWSASPSTYGTYTWTPSEPGAPGGTSADLDRSYATAGTYTMSVTASGLSATCPLITVGAVCSGPTVSITASKPRVVQGDTTTLTVTGSGITGSCTVTGPGISQTITAASCNVGPTTITTPPITGQSTYIVTCTGATDQVIVNIVPKFEEF